MGYNVHLHVCFSCSTNEGVAAVAKRHLDVFGSESLFGGRRYARAFLLSLAERTGPNLGPKGGLSLWGIVGNGKGIAGVFMETLRQFWKQLLSGIEGGPSPFGHILVFYEEEATEAANAYEVFWDDDKKPDRELTIRHHEQLPFTWYQM